MEKVAVFANLQSFKSYYPMIALNRPQAFYGLPPPSVIPNAIFESTNRVDRSHSPDQNLYSRLSSADSMQPRSLMYHRMLLQSRVLQMSQATGKRYARDSQEKQEGAQSKRPKNAWVEMFNCFTRSVIPLPILVNSNDQFTLWQSVQSNSFE